MSNAAAPQTSTLLLVMDMVDQMRHENIALNETIQQLQSDQSITEHLMRLYAQNGITVTPDLIAQALEAYRKEQFALPKVTQDWRLKLANLYVTRSQWKVKALKRTGAFAATAGLLGALWYALLVLPEQKAFAQSVQSFNSTAVTVSSQSQQMIAALQQLAVKLQTLQPQTITQAYVGAQKIQLLAQIEALLSQHQTLPPLPLLAMKNTQDAPRLQEATVEQKTLVGVHQNFLQKGQQLQSQSSALFELVLLEQRFESLKNKIPTQQLVTIDQIESALSTPDIALSRSLLIKAQEGIAQQEAVQMALQRTQNMQKKIASADLSAAARSDLEQLIAEAQRSARSANTLAVQEQLSLIDGLLSEAQMDLRYTIVSRQGVKSGVERFANDAPNAKRYYLIVEALDPFGKAQPVRFKNIETAQMHTATLFGVEVPKEVFEKVKQDKQDDGIVQNALVAQKPKGELAISPIFPVLEGRISSW